MASTRAVRMVRGTLPRSARRWDDAAATLIGDQVATGAGFEPVQVCGGPGTGKTSLLIDVAVARLRAPSVSAESVLVLTPGSRAARAMRARITIGSSGAHGPGTEAATVREPLVRTVHSYAFAVLRLQAAREDNPPPRLITGPEQDAVIRELLRGDVGDGAPRWPPVLRPALGLNGFATELRNLLLQATELGLGPEDLVRLGRARSRPEWVAAGRFGLSYEQSVLLRAAVGMEAPQASAPAVDAAGLVAAAVDALAGDRQLLADERARVRHLLVDDAQHLDAGAAELVRMLGTGAETVIAGDPDQGVFGFRGADPRFFTELAPVSSHRVLLTGTHRCAPRVARAVAAISARLPGTGAVRGPAPVGSVVGDSGARSPADEGSVGVRVLGTVAQEAAVVADTLRRAHLTDGVPYAHMAVVVRSLERSLAPLRRALLAAGVPLSVPSDAVPLARQHAVAGFLLALRALTTAADDVLGFGAEHALSLLASPLGRADPVALRRLQRGVRRGELAAGGARESPEVLRELVLGVDVPGVESGLTDAEVTPLRRLRRTLDAAAAPLREGRGVEDVLWALWQGSGLERRWVAAADRGGTSGAQADRDLDAVVALFDAAARYVDRLPRAPVAGFVSYLDEQEIAGDTGTDRAPAGDAVTVLTAHAAAGQEWTLVVVAGVQEGLWPSLRSRGSLLAVEHLVDEVSGGPGPELVGVLSRTAPVLAEERRLFLVACSRARQRLLVTAVRSTGGDAELTPSRFLDELDPGGPGSGDPGPGPDGPGPDGPPAAPDTGRPGRALVLGELTADLRATVCDPAASTARRGRAAVQLARLAAAGVPGAHPSQWYGLGPPSSDAELVPDGVVTVSPSTVEKLGACPLRWVLERHGGEDGSAVAALTGTLVHTLVQAIAGHTHADEVDAALVRTWSAVDVGAPWFAEHELERTRAMLETFRSWWQRSRAELTEVAVEIEVDATVSGELDGEHVSARVKGRIDRLERDALGRLVVVDVKTGRTPVTAREAAENAQLAVYQLALLEGGLAGPPDETAPTAGGAHLVYVAKENRTTGATQRSQPAPDAETTARWRAQVLAAALAARGPGFPAVVNDKCGQCAVRSACPAQDSGRQVTDG